MAAGRYRQNADDCLQRSLQARTPADKANWLKIAEEWQKLVACNCSRPIPTDDVQCLALEEALAARSGCLQF
jgi:hypothetical protein